MTQLNVLVILGFAAGGLLTETAAHAQNQSPVTALRITSPLTGTSVHPGDYIQVTVTPVTGPGIPAVQQVFLGGEGIGFTSPQKAPFQFGLRIPPSIKPGPRSLYALGRIANSQGIDALSDPIVLEVERLDRPVRVVVEPDALYLEIHPGSDPKSSEEHLRVYYQYADGARVPVPPKTYGLNTVVFRPQVGNVTVNPLGVVSPFRAGTDQVWVDCVACAGGTDPGPVSVTVTAPALYVARKSISAGAQGGSFNLDVATNGLSYRVDGETWAHGGVSITTDQVHWSATVTIDRNPSTQPRVGTLRFTLTSGAVQDVVVYQGGTA